MKVRYKYLHILQDLICYVICLGPLLLFKEKKKEMDQFVGLGFFLLQENENKVYLNLMHLIYLIHLIHYCCVYIPVRQYACIYIYIYIYIQIRTHVI